jgi:hypothetical protein
MAVVPPRRWTADWNTGVKVLKHKQRSIICKVIKMQLLKKHSNINTSETPPDIATGVKDGFTQHMTLLVFKQD